MGLWLDTNLWLYKDTFFIAMSPFVLDLSPFLWMAIVGMKEKGVQFFVALFISSTWLDRLG